MSKKVYYTIISLFLAAIFITIGVFTYRQNVKAASLDIRLIVKSQQQGFDFWELLKKGAQEGAKEFNVTLSVSGPDTEEDVSGQIALFEEAIAAQPDAIILAPTDEEALLPYAKEAVQQGIKLILVDSALSEQVGNCFVGTDNYDAAKSIGSILAGQMGKKGKVAVISHMTQTTTAKERCAGLESAIGRYPDMEMLGPYDIGDSTQKSYEQTMKVLEENPDLAGIFATNQISAEGVTRAINETGRSSLVYYAFDSSVVQNEALESGTVDGFAVQMPFNMGYLSLTAAVDACNGKLRQTNINTGFTLATQENMRREDIQKLIYPFV